MNVAASNSIHPQIQGRTDLPAAAGPASEADGDSGDPVAFAHGDSQDFEKILSDVDKGRHPVLAGTPVDARPLEAAADRRIGTATKEAADPTAAADPRAVLLDGKNDPSNRSAADPSKTTKSDHKTDDPTSDPAADLAAQLAMASQWTPVAPAAVPQRNESTADDGKSTKAKSDGPSAGTDTVAANRAATIAAVDLAQVQGTVVPAVVPAAVNVAAFSADRNPRPTGAQTTNAVSATAKSESLKEEETSRLSTPDSTAASIDKLFNLVAGNTSTASLDPTSITSQFVTQISAQVSNAQNSLTAAATSAQPALRESVGTPAWSQELGQTALRMATNDLQNASLRLNPEHLGPLDVQMRIDNGVAHMQFTAAHADTRHALESSRATLDHMLGDQGIKLGDWSVGNSSANGSFARSFGTASSQGDGSRPSTNDTGEADGDTVSATVTTRATRPLGLVDTFA